VFKCRRKTPHAKRQPLVRPEQPNGIYSDNWSGFARHVMQAWAAMPAIEHRFMQSGKPTQITYTESFNSRFREEYLPQHWFVSPTHMRSVIKNRRED
jgi:putative transposase